MNILEAVKEAKTGKKIRRKEWFFINKDNCIFITGIRNLKIRDKGNKRIYNKWS